MMITSSDIRKGKAKARISGLLLLLCIIVLSINGCGDINDNENVGSIYFDSAFTTGCCNERHVFEFDDDAYSDTSGYYYWIAAKNIDDKMVGYGPGLYIEPPFWDAHHYIDINYTFDLPNGFYDDLFFTVWRTRYEGNVGQLNKQVSSSRVFVRKVGFIHSIDNCRVECCTKTKNRYRAYATKDIGNLIGVSANIKTRYGKVCGQDYAVDNCVPAHGIAWIGLQDSLFGKTTPFALFGYRYERTDTSGYPIDTLIYAEVRVSSITYAFKGKHNQGDSNYIPLPTENQYYSYSIDMEHMPSIDNCLLTLTYDDTVSFIEVTVPDWANKTFRYATWQCEISGLETDMPGDSMNPCVFEQCKYEKNDDNGDRIAHFRNTDNIDVTQHMPNRAEWKIDYTDGGSTLSIYDIYKYDD